MSIIILSLSLWTAVMTFLIVSSSVIGRSLSSCPFQLCIFGNNMMVPNLVFCGRTLCCICILTRSTRRSVNFVSISILAWSNE